LRFVPRRAPAWELRFGGAGNRGRRYVDEEGMAQGGGEARRFWDLTEVVIGACIEVHRDLGPGLLESAYEECLCHELAIAGLRFARQRPLAVRYKGVLLDCGYRLDIVVQEQLILELKAVDRLLPVHEAQVLTYLKLTGLDVGLLINFNIAALRQGLRRLARRAVEPATHP
jgi:GxxExxY protein